MSDDLISRDALLKDFRNMITEQSDTMDWLNIIARQPTAYDLDKVVEQLKKQIGTCEMEDCEQYNGDCDVCRAGKAIEIVKAGGVNE